LAVASIAGFAFAKSIQLDFSYLRSTLEKLGG
jgi:hypothetical protein